MAKFRSTNYPSLSVATADGQGSIRFRGSRFETDDEDQAARIRDVAKRYPHFGISEVDENEAQDGESAAPSGDQVIEASSGTTAAEAEAQHPNLDLGAPPASEETPAGPSAVVAAQAAEEVEAQEVNAAAADGTETDPDAGEAGLPEAEADGSDGASEDEEVAVEDLSVPELRAELRERGLETGGNKAALVERLNQALDADEA